MLFNSIEFIIFLPTSLIVFLFIRSRGLKELSFAWLVLASLFFYGWWEARYLILIASSILVNFAIGNNISKIQYAVGKKTVLVVGILFNLFLLGYFKYADFFISNVNNTFGTGYHLRNVVLPLAISFFTFQQIAYLVDAYRGEVEEYNFIHYCLFVTFFPQLIAGPIVHHKEMMPQFMRDKNIMPKVQDFTVGIFIFVLGLFKKIVLADSFAPVADQVFMAADAGATISTVDAWAGSLAYTFQLYFDFSGYSDMAIGAARMFGIRLPQNFNSPYQSTSISEFWRRWHMTLSRFLRDYLYIALGGNRHGQLRKYTNLLTTMVLGGLWHGAGWNFVIWGTLHGIYLVINHAWTAFIDRKLSAELRTAPEFIQLRNWFGFTVTFIAVIFAWVFFRATTFEGATMIATSMIGMNQAGSEMFAEACAGCNVMVDYLQFSPDLARWVENNLASQLFLISCGLIMAFFVTVFLKNTFSYVEFEAVDSTRLSFAIGLLGFTTLLFVFASMVNNEPSPFLYFQF